ncbi:hypothetical protein FRB91_002117 [Serendipita sp. 411]|nr:hypothetical protein FRB91_002117 [Serendipita sp. 411]
MASTSTSTSGARPVKNRRRPDMKETAPIAASWPTETEILVADLEATCWNNPSDRPAGQYNEIIEIGWAIVNLEKGETTRNGTILVKPVRSTVSAFCTQLTTITTELLEEEGVTLADAFRTLVDDVKSHTYSWASWGDYDRNMIQRQCKAFKLDSPFSTTHYNVKTLFKELYPGLGIYGMDNVWKQVMTGRHLEGTHHRGGDDAKNISSLLAFAMEKKHASAGTSSNTGS